MRKFEVLNEWVDSSSKVLVLGCGNGDILKELKKQKDIRASGLDLDENKVYEAISEGLPVIQGDINRDLTDWPKKSFDFIIAHDIVQIMTRPDVTIKQMVELGGKVIISFPNFAYFMIRLEILFSGRMPKSKILPYEWYNTPNIHLFTIKDFKEFCRDEKITIHKESYTGAGKRKTSKKLIPNFFAEFAYFLIS
jgi:methionine biosynthesis protein MetW